LAEKLAEAREQVHGDPAPAEMQVLDPERVEIDLVIDEGR
jgi:hypothetical protein